jgi:hypothetical protein
MKFTKVSIAVAALLGNISAVHVKVNTGNGETLSALASVDAMYEPNRFFGADGKPMILAETEGHARIELTKVPKYSAEFKEQTLIQIENEKKPKD